MDKKDFLILQELDQNVRESYNKIAKKLQLSKETVQYRVQKLEEEKIITGYWALPKIGHNFFTYKLFLKNKGLSSTEKKKFETFVEESLEVSWFAQTNGSWTYIVTLMSSEDWKISTFLSRIFEDFSNKFVDIQILKSIGTINLNEKFLYDKPPIQPIYDSFLEPPIKLDSTENEVISLLTKNARMKYSEIGCELKLTPEAISHRFKQINKKKVIKKLKLRVNFEKLGFHYYHLLINFGNGAIIPKAEEYFISDKNTTFLMRHVGKYQLHAEIVCKDDEINDIITKFLDSFSEDIADYDLCKIEKEFKLRVNK